MPHIFISYAWKDGSQLARRLHGTFNARDGWSAWMDVKLHADTVFSHALQMQIDRADVVVVVLSPEVNRRDPPSFVQRELVYATQDGVNKPVFGARAHNCPVPLIVAGITYQDFFDGADYDAAFARLLAHIEASPRARPAASLRERELAYLRTVAREHGFWGKVYVDTPAEARSRPQPDPATATVTDPDIAAYLGEIVMAIHPEKRHSPDDDARAETVESFAALTDALVQFERVAIIGDPGSGKTTTLRRFAYNLGDAAANDDDAPLPVFVPLGGYTGGNLNAYIQQQMPELPLPQYLPERLVVLLDGLNETAHENVADVQAWLDANPNVRVLLTCRKLDYIERKLDLQRVDVLPLDADGILTFMAAYDLDKQQRHALFTGLGLAGNPELRAIWDLFQAASLSFDDFWTGKPLEGGHAVYSKSTGQQDDIYNSMRSAMREGVLPGLLGLVRNPFLLMLTIAIFSKSGQAPRNRGELFRNFVRMLFEQRGKPAARVRPPWIDEDIQRAVLAALSYRMQRETRGTRVPRAWARGVVAEAAPNHDPDHVLYLAASAGIIELGAEVRFTHQLLQEYFAAFGMAEDMRQSAPASKYWPGDRWWEPTGWEETALLLAGMEGDATETVRWLTPVNPILAYRCATESGVPCDDQTMGALYKPADGARLAPLAVAAWGRELAAWGDPRPGMLAPDGVPDMAWAGPIEAGPFQMGGDPKAWNNWEGAEFDLLYPFWIAKYPVTYAQYAAFVAAGGYQERAYWTEAGWEWKGDKEHPEYGWNDPQWHIANHPVVGVTWYEAYAFAQWLNTQVPSSPALLPQVEGGKVPENYVIRLLRECEWEKAARYPDGRLFPWGDEWDPTRLNWGESGIGRTSAVGMFPNGANPAHGAHDLSGNVWEWCLTEWGDQYESPAAENNDPAGAARRVARGGSWNNQDNNCRAAARDRNNPNNRGFRVCVPVHALSIPQSCRKCRPTHVWRTRQARLHLRLGVLWAAKWRGCVLFAPLTVRRLAWLKRGPGANS